MNSIFKLSLLSLVVSGVFLTTLNANTNTEEGLDLPPVTDIKLLKMSDEQYKKNMKVYQNLVDKIDMEKLSKSREKIIQNLQKRYGNN